MQFAEWLFPLRAFPGGDGASAIRSEVSRWRSVADQPELPRG
jgi:hypothetical protein